MTNTFLDSIKVRRSIYALDKNVSVEDSKIEEIIKDAVKYSPSSFNSQSSRAVILLGENHDKLWNIVEDTLRAIVPAENFAATEEKVGSFRAGYGTVLFFEDTAVIEGLQKTSLYMQTTSLYGLNNLQVLHNIQYGLLLQTLELVHLYNITTH